jgi:hypothetical protein
VTPTSNAETGAQRPSRKKAQIELSSLFWYQDTLPASITLVQSSIKVTGVKSGITGLYGLRGRHEGFVAARNHVLAVGQQYTAVDFRVQLSEAVDLNKRSESNVQDQDIFPAHLLTREYAVDMDNRLRGDLHMRRKPSEELGADCLLRTLEQHPSAINTLMGYPELEHVRLFIYMAKPTFADQPMAIATVPDKHLGSIVSTHCRLDPDLQVSLPASPSNSLEEKPVIGLANKPPTGPRR